MMIYSFKDAFAELVNIFKALVDHFEQQRKASNGTPPISNDGSINVPSTFEKANEEEAFKLLEGVLDCMRTLVQGMMDLLELSEDKPEVSQEIPVSEIDPKKVNCFKIFDNF